MKLNINNKRRFTGPIARLRHTFYDMNNVPARNRSHLNVPCCSLWEQIISVHRSALRFGYHVYVSPRSQLVASHFCRIITSTVHLMSCRGRHVLSVLYYSLRIEWESEKVWQDEIISLSVLSRCYPTRARLALSLSAPSSPNVSLERQTDIISSISFYRSNETFSFELRESGITATWIDWLSTFYF